MGSRYLHLLVIALTISYITSAVAQEKPRIIKVIGTGKAQSTPILASWFTAEPSTDAIIFPTRIYGDITSTDIKRLMRIYFPRTYRDLLNYEFYFMAQVEMQFIGPKQEKWIYDALTEGQKGAVNTRSVMSQAKRRSIPWRDSIISDAFPNDAPAVISSIDKREPGKLVIKDEPDIPNIMKAFKEPIEAIFPQYGGLITIPKPGSVILSYTQNNAGLGHPIPGQVAHVFYWRWNRSITFTFQDMVYNRFWSTLYSTGQGNPYALDIIANIVWFSTGREIPRDSYKVHDFRRSMYEFQIKKNLLVSLLDFAEKYGANPSDEYDQLDQAESTKTTAANSYLDGDFDMAYDEIQNALSRMAEIEEKAAELKDRALFWIYVVEWIVTTGISLFAGFILWTLMIRRALYREVGQTRAF